MDSPLAAQDRAGITGPGLGLFLSEVLVSMVDETTDPYGLAAVAAADAANPGTRHEALLVCARHPGQAAVDCLDCEPLAHETVGTYGPGQDRQGNTDE